MFNIQSILGPFATQYDFVERNQTEVVVKVKRLPHGQDLPLPAYAKPGDAGADLRAAIEDRLTIHPGQDAAIPTGIAIELPEGYEAQVRGRSGLALNYQIGITNGVGTVDAAFRGEVLVLLYNHGSVPFVVGRGDRIAQMVVKPVPTTVFMEVDELSDSIRGETGFGSSGRK
jgi:dUTP pyrophosphatase